MAQNKKQKVDFSSALKEAATKLMPKKEESKAKEFVIADIGGQPTKLFRGDSSDKEWEATKERAERQNSAAEQPSAGPGMSVLGNVAEMATGATPSEDRGFVETVRDALNPIKTMEAGRGVIEPAAAMAKRVLTPISVKEGAAMDALDPGVDAEAVQRDAMLQQTAAPVAMPQVAPQMAPEVMPEAAPMGAPAPSIDLPMEIAPPPSMNISPIVGDREAMMRAYETAKEAETLKGELESGLQTQKAQLLAKQQEDEVRLQERAALAQNTHAERMKQSETGLIELQSHLKDLERQAPDPNRYWNNKDAGQKAAAIVAGALFGASGQGMQWLSRLDSLVEKDIQQQASELNRKEGVIGKQINSQNNLVALAKEKGLSDQEAISAARLAMKQDYANRFTIAAETTGSEMVKVRAIENKAKIEMSMQRDLQEMQSKTQQMAHQASSEAISRYNAQTSRMNVVSDAQARQQAATVKHQPKYTPGESERLVAAQSAWDALPALKAAVGDGSLGSASKDQIMKMFPGTDAAARDQQAQLMGRIIFSGIDKSVINAADQEFLNKLQSGVGLRSMSQGDIPAFERLLEASYNSVLKTAKSREEGTLHPLQKMTLKTERPAK